MDNNRPTFGVNTATVPTTEGATNKRTESGAIWKRVSSRDNSEFLSIRLKLSKERLQALLAKTGDTVDVGFVAFNNPFKNEGPKRPDFRVYEDKE